MILLDPTYIRDNCDYSFGDQSGAQCQAGYMKPANINNIEFINKYNNLIGKKSFMTLFIDNIRLYNRNGIKYTSMELINSSARYYKDQAVAKLFPENDLLKLCGELKDMKFVVFTGFEDTPIDEFIFDKIPENVIGIYASNAIDFGGKVIPIPYGIQRKMSYYDNRQNILRQMIDNKNLPTNLLYINHSIGVNPERITINEMLSNKSWVTISSPTSISDGDYLNYLMQIKSHKFMICPSGNAIGCECHRDWEVIYMKRVPIVKRSKYLEYIFKDVPVLFVNDFKDINEDLLIKNEHLYEEMQNFDITKLDMKLLYDNIIKNINL
jgi:hypothetical protein